jgi:hypothetical protein
MSNNIVITYLYAFSFLFGSPVGATNNVNSQIYHSNVSVEYMVAKHHIELKKYGCLSEIFFKNRVKPNTWTSIGQKGIESPRHASHVLYGTTFWINEHAAVGHLMYDIQLLQVLQSIQVDRIVLQRAPCTTSDLCQGIGTWNSFYKGYYLMALRAAHWIQSGDLVVYLRFQEEVALSPYGLSSDGWDLVKRPTAATTGGKIKSTITLRVGVGSPPNRTVSSNNNPPPPILLNQDSLCFDQLVRRGQESNSFYNSLAQDVVDRFRQAAYEYLHHAYPDRALPSDRTANSTEPLIITYAYRGATATRHTSNTSQVETALRRAFTELSTLHTTVRVVDTSSNSWPFVDQMLLAASTDIFVTDHGAFESNMIYMRPGGCVVELRGNYSTAAVESGNFCHLGAMFGVRHRSVLLSNLTEHRDTRYVMASREVERVVRLVRDCTEGK